MHHVKPSKSQLSWHEKLVSFDTVQEVANKKKVVRFEGIQDNNSVTDIANNNDPTKRETIRHHKPKKGKLRRKQNRKAIIERQKMEERIEDLESFSFKNFVTACENIENVDGIAFRNNIIDEKPSVNLLTAIFNDQDYHSLDKVIQKEFNELKGSLIKKKMHFSFEYYLAKSLKSELREKVINDVDDIEQDSLQVSDKIDPQDVVVPPGINEVLNYDLTCVETKQKMNVIMNSVLEKEEKREALQVWLQEIGSAMGYLEWNKKSCFSDFKTYVDGADFDPNDIVEHFKTRESVSVSVDRSSHGTNNTTIPSDEESLAGVQFATQEEINDNNNYD